MLVAVLLRRVFLLALLALPQYFWLRNCWRAAGRPQVHRVFRWMVGAAIAVLIAAMVLVLYDRIFSRILPSSVTGRIAPLIQLWIFSSTFAFYLMLPFRAADWCWRRIKRAWQPAAQDMPQDSGRRSILYHAGSLVAALPFAGAIYGFSAERLRFEVVRIDAPIANLPPALDGFRIVQLSDIHIGDLMPVHELRRAVAMANDLRADLAVVTGDFLTSRGDPLAECIAELSRLRAPLGVFGCNGNHEIYAGAEPDAESLFRQYGMRLLRQSAEQVAWNGAQLNIIGIDYQRNVPFTGKIISPPIPVAPLVRHDMPNLLLSHNPNTFPSAAEQGIELTLSGHTHGGQVKIEILNSTFTPARLMTDFVAGLYQLPMPKSDSAPRRKACLYVNRGLGTLGFPARIGANPEITLLTLRPARS